jgi:hypothetical protein
VQAQEVRANGDFEAGLQGWSGLWTRLEGGGQVALDEDLAHGGRRCARIDHTGPDDWSFMWGGPMPVEPGRIFEFAGWVRLQGQGTVHLGVVLRDADGRVLDWEFAERRQTTPTDWTELKSRFVVPAGVAALQPRFIGYRPATVWIDDVTWEDEGMVEEMAERDLPEALTMANAALEVVLHTADATLSVTDRRTGRAWQQRPLERDLLLSTAEATGTELRLGFVSVADARPLAVTFALAGDGPELSVELTADGEMGDDISYPHPFATRAGDVLIMPVNEGISYPVDDDTLDPMRYILYGGHGICMPWYGVMGADGEGVMAIVDTPDDASVAVPRLGGLLCEAPVWQPQKGLHGYPRRMRYVFLPEGGYVAMAKRYRAYALESGLLKTLAQKRQERPALDMLIGAVNVWCWQNDAPAFCREMQEAGIDRILWSHRRGPEEVAELNEMGVLTSRYDIYQDVMDPANFPNLRWQHPDWPTEAWPQDLMISADGTWTKGWRVRGTDGEWYPCGVLCDAVAAEYARRRIGEELKTHAYRCRFIDTTTATPWRECYDPDHPLTRTESRETKMELLNVVSEELGLVCGSETGHDAAVPYVDYFEGMLSLGPYRVPDAGRRMRELVFDVPERVAKFQTGHFYRLPLWELVYHDCVVAHWYWGDYNNKLPDLWDRRDLINVLYGTAPMFMYDRRVWDEYRDRFAQSYRTVGPVARACGYSEMLDHRWMTSDHAVQQTRFSNGVTVTVNFGDAPFSMPDGRELAPLSHVVDGLPGD